MSDLFDPFEVWRLLLQLEHSSAAAGLIRDVFEGITEREGMTSELRESAMQILDDGDGTALCEWLELYQTDLAGFDLQAAVWAERCVEEGMFDA